MKKIVLLLFIVLCFVGCTKKNQLKDEAQIKKEDDISSELISEKSSEIIDETIESPDDITNIPLVNTKDFFESCNLLEDENTQIQFLSYSLANEGSIKIIKDNNTIKTITKAIRPSYSPLTKCIYYLLEDNKKLQAYNIITCTEVENNKLQKSGSLIVNDIYLMNNNKDKLYLFCAKEDEYGGVYYYIDEYELNTDSHKYFHFSTWTDFNDTDLSLQVNDICILNNGSFLFSLSEAFNEDEVLFAVYTLENDSLKKTSDYTLKNAYAWKNNFSHLYPIDGSKALVNVVENENIKTYILDSNSNSIRFTELPEEMLSVIINKNNEYIGTVKYEDPDFENYSIKIYDAEKFTSIMNKDFHSLKAMNSIYNFGYSGLTTEINIQEYLEK